MTSHNENGCIVITGSSKGIGFGLAEAFLRQGKSVVISGRNIHQLQVAYERLSQSFDSNKILAIPCDISKKNDVQNLWNQASEHFQSIQVWINNAGACNATTSFIDVPTQEIESVIQTNVLGTVICAQIALQGMLKQGHGQIFNMEGWGSRGEWSAGTTIYSTTKCAVGYFSKALYKETKSTNILVGTLSPGMVATDLLISSWKNGKTQNWNKMKRLFYFIIDPPDIVCHYLAQRISQNNKTNTRIIWMTPWRLFLRFLQPYYWRRNPVKNTDLEHFG